MQPGEFRESATWPRVAWMKMPLAGPPGRQALGLQLLEAFSTVFGLIASEATTSRTFGS